MESIEKKHTHNHNHHHPNYNHHHSHVTTTPPPHLNLSFHTILIIIISIISIIILFAITLIVLMIRRLKSKSISSCKDTDNFVLHSIGINFTSSSPDVKGGCFSAGRPVSRQSTPKKERGVQVFTYKELEAATSNFRETNLIRDGKFGVVYKGTLNDGTVAAIKRLHRNGKPEEMSFRMEVDLLSNLQSVYLVNLLGYCADQNHRLLVFEFMPNGTLQNHIQPNFNKSKSLDWRTRLMIALDCARALEFLHEYAVPMVIHSDFSCANVLLDKHFRAKVSGFGSAKTGSDRINGQILTRVSGTTGYLAPEYGSTGKLTTKSDVYSFGVLLLELLTGRIPVDTKRPSGEHVLVSWALPRLTNREKVEEMVDPILKGQYTKKDLVQIAAIAAMCVQTEADYRPLITDVVQSLIPLVKPFNNSTSSSRSFNQYGGNQYVGSPRF